MTVRNHAVLQQRYAILSGYNGRSTGTLSSVGKIVFGVRKFEVSCRQDISAPGSRPVSCHDARCTLRS